METMFLGSVGTGERHKKFCEAEMWKPPLDKRQNFYIASLGEKAHKHSHKAHKANEKKYRSEEPAIQVMVGALLLKETKGRGKNKFS